MEKIISSAEYDDDDDDDYDHDDDDDDDDGANEKNLIKPPRC